MSGLQFQSFTSADFSTNRANDLDFDGQIGDKNQPTNASASGPKRNFFSFSYYQQFFDVDTEQVTKRLLNSAIPTHNSFIADFIQPIPDLYGPFWVAVTLVFSIGIFSNIAQYIENEGGSGDYGSDFRMVTGATSLITAYLVLLPLGLYWLIWYRKSEVQFSYFEILCAYGYSLTIFIPASFLWVINSEMLRWALIGISVVLSGTVLVKALWPAFKNDSNKMISFGVMFGIILSHFLLAYCFKEQFFDPAHVRPAVSPQKLPDVNTLAFNDTNGAVQTAPPKIAEGQMAPVLEMKKSSENETEIEDKKALVDQIEPKKEDPVSVLINNHTPISNHTNDDKDSAH